MKTANDDNIYPLGTPIYARVNPSLQLIVRNYYHRIYYCGLVGNPAHKQFAYFERELIAPGVTPDRETHGDSKPAAPGNVG